jgi:GNAT superfamily N-acetyltransferase
MSLRRATADDLDEIVALIGELAEYERSADEVVLDRDALAAHLFGAAPAASVVMAIDDDSSDVAGFALYFPTFSTWLGRPGLWLEDLFVRPHFRGRGHGLALLQHLRTLTDGRVEWSVLDWNQPAIDFYDVLGARPVPGWTRYRWI